MISKQKVRGKVLEHRDGLDPAWRLENSRSIVKKVLDSELYKRAEIILSYSSIRSEVETDFLNRTVLEHGKQLYLPKTDFLKKQMHFYPVEDLSLLHEGYQGILEPEEAMPLEDLFSEEKENLDGKETSDGRFLMVMPGAGFDENGNRMGYGGGYYDRYLRRYREYLTSLFIAFYEQKMPFIPTESFDRKPDYIMTQRGLLEIEGGERI